MAAVLAAVLVLSLTGCGDEGGDEEDGASSRPPADTTADTGDTTSDTTPSSGVEGPRTEEEQVLAAVECYWDTIVAANDPPDPDHPDFDRCFTGAALATSRQNTRDHQALGQRVVDPSGVVDRFGTTVTISDGTALVTECLVDDAVVTDVASGAVLNDRILSLELELRLEFIDAAWKVADNRAINDERGTGLCAGL